MKLIPTLSKLAHLDNHTVRNDVSVQTLLGSQTGSFYVVDG